MTQNNPVHANSRFSSLWRKELWGYFSKKSKEDIRKHITLPKYELYRRGYKKSYEIYSCYSRGIRYS
jgi:hypothetical protein